MLSIQIGSSSRGGGGIAGRLFGTVFCFAFLAGGVFFFYLIGREITQRVDTYRWTALPCTISSSHVITDHRSENPYRLEVQFEYRLGGHAYSSTKVQLSEIRSANYGDILRRASNYPPGARSTCYANPKRPEQAVLQRSSLWFGLLILFPLPFIAIGVLGMVAIWSGGRIGSKAATPLSSAPKSGTGCLVLFFAVFLVAGAAATSAMLIRPLWQIAQARQWNTVPCTIVSSEIRSHSSSDGTTYSVDIFYRYKINGAEYRANRYVFGPVSSSRYKGKQEIVSQYPPGRFTTCYVNPSDPTDAVLIREATAGLWFGLIPLLFVVIGIGGISFAIRKSRQSRSPVPGIEAARAIPAGGDMEDPESSSLKARTSPLGRFVGSVMIALFWNGIVSVFVGHLFSQWRHGRSEVFLTLFMIPFVLIGTVLIGYSIYSFLALFSPRVALTSNASSAIPGAAVQLSWNLTGNASKVRNLRIYFEGREEATYTRGTRSTTDQAVFATIPIKEVPEAQSPSGTVEFIIPADAIHSFNAPKNKIIWAIWVKAEVIRMPDIKDEFPFTVLPQPMAPPVKT
jgi:hypothetical protein